MKRIARVFSTLFKTRTPSGKYEKTPANSWCTNPPWTNNLWFVEVASAGAVLLVLENICEERIAFFQKYMGSIARRRKQGK
jgi:hypothetical protein